MSFLTWLYAELVKLWDMVKSNIVVTTVTAGAAATIVLSQSSPTVGAGLPDTYTALVTDAGSNPVAGVQLYAFYTIGSGTTVVPISSVTIPPTGANGQTTFSVTEEVVGAYNVYVDTSATGT